jgi:hypothetical protein
MNDALQTSAIQWASQLEMSIKEHPIIIHYEISIELSHSKVFSNELDGRNRWGNNLKSFQDIHHQFQIRVFLSNGRFSFLQDVRRFADSEQTPTKVIESLLEESNQLPHSSERTIFANNVHQSTSLEIWDPRFDVLDAALRKELIQDQYTMISQMNKKSRLQKIELKEVQLMRHVRTSKNVLSEQSTQYELMGIVANGIERSPFHFLSRRFADLCTHPFGWTTFYPPPLPNKSVAEIDPAWMLMLAPNVVASIVACLPPAFELDRLEKGTSFLAGKQGQAVGSKRIHIIDDPTMLSGVNSRSFDVHGVPSKPLTLIADGVFQDCYVPLDSETNKAPTGHSGMNGQLWCGNILSQMGRRSQKMILADKGDALMGTHLIEPTHLNIETGILRLVVNFAHISSKGFEGNMGTKTIVIPILELFAQVSETANDQNRYNHVDASTWVLDDCRILRSPL